MDSNIAKQLVDSLHDSLATAIENLADSIKTEANLLAETRMRRINEMEAVTAALRDELKRARDEVGRQTAAGVSAQAQIAKEQEKVRELEAQLRTIRPGHADHELAILRDLEAYVCMFQEADEGDDPTERALAKGALMDHIDKIKEWRNRS
jgi:hypothetical protein